MPEFCEVKVDVRLVPGQSWQDTYEAIRRVITASSSEVRWEFDPHTFGGRAFLPEKRRQCGAGDVCCGGDKPIAGRQLFPRCEQDRRRGYSCLIFGPGDIAEAHTARESIAIADLERGVEEYVHIAKRLLPP